MARLVSASLFLALTLVVGCGHSIPDMTLRSTTPQPQVQAPADQAMFVVFHGGRDGTNVVLFTEDGTPVCQVPHASHCLMALAPGHYRIYITWDRVFSDAWDLDVVAGRTYYATMATGWSFMDEKLTPASTNWAHLAEYMQGAEVGLDPAQVPMLRTELGNFQELIQQADHRMERYDERHLEAHTIHPEDGV
jgi:hypothetical protein